jgi:hypothetical protein
MDGGVIEDSGFLVFLILVDENATFLNVGNHPATKRRIPEERNPA